MEAFSLIILMMEKDIPSSNVFKEQLRNYF